MTKCPSFVSIGNACQSCNFLRSMPCTPDQLIIFPSIPFSINAGFNSFDMELGHNDGPLREIGLWGMATRTIVENRINEVYANSWDLTWVANQTVAPSGAQSLSRDRPTPEPTRGFTLLPFLESTHNHQANMLCLVARFWFAQPQN